MHYLQNSKRRFSLAILASTLLISACGGGGGGTDPDPDPGAGNNQAPSVNCSPVSGQPETGTSVSINCAVTDDGLPANSVTSSWSLKLAPQGVTGLNVPQTSAISYTPAIAGNYTLQLSADDGGLTTTADVSFAVTAAPIQGTIKILPLGDSITQGDQSLQSYRYPLWKKLVDASLDFDFVGSLTENNNGNPAFPDYNGFVFDRDHEGHWGFRADEILNNLPGYLSNYSVDVALIHLGTNDISFNQEIASTINELEQIIGALRFDNPAVSILLAEPIPAAGHNVAIADLGAAVKQLALDLNTAQSRVISVDQASEFDIALDRQDDIHPNASGEEKIAQKWFDAITNVLGI